MAKKSSKTRRPPVEKRGRPSKKKVRAAASGHSRRLARRRASKLPLSERLWWRVVRGTAKGTAKGVATYVPRGYRGSKDAVTRFRANQRFDEGYVPEDGEIPPRKVWLFRETFRCCGRRFANAEMLNDHHEREHGAEDAAHAERIASGGTTERPRPRLVLSNTARSTGKRKVVPVKNVPTGRHRSRKPGSTRVDDLIARHREEMTKIGKAAAMNDEAVRGVKQGFRELEEGRVGGLSTIEDTALGFEQAFAVGAEAFETYRLKLIQMGFDPAHLQSLRRVAADLESASVDAARFIATLKDELRDDIAAAKKRLAGETPDDSTLAS